MILGAIEAGGTKIICGIGDENGHLIEKVHFPTLAPEETIPEIINYFKDKDIVALGIGTFGPVDVNINSKTYGYILDSPKVGWSMYPLLDELKKYIHVPMMIDTDVNGAALGESLWGIAKDKPSCIYITIGTGVGAGYCSDKKLLHGLLHPEMGHIMLKQHKDDDFAGICRFHGNCLEGLASGPAIEKRFNTKAINLEETHLAWEIEAYYIAQALMNYTLILSPHQIILGGGVMKQQQLFPLIRKNFKELMNGYINKPELMEHIDDYIVYPGLGDHSGTYGSLALATLLIENLHIEKG